MFPLLGLPAHCCQMVAILREPSEPFGLLLLLVRVHHLGKAVQHGQEKLLHEDHPHRRFQFLWVRLLHLVPLFARLVHDGPQVPDVRSHEDHVGCVLGIDVELVVVSQHQCRQEVHAMAELLEFSELIGGPCGGRAGGAACPCRPMPTRIVRRSTPAGGMGLFLGRPGLLRPAVSTSSGGSPGPRTPPPEGPPPPSGHLTPSMGAASSCQAL